MTIGGVIILALPPYTWFSNVCGGLAFVTGVGFLVIAHREKKKLESK